MPNSLRNNPIMPMNQLLIFLRYVDSNGFQSLIAESFNVSQTSVCRIIERVARAINRRLRHVICMPNAVETGEIQRAYQEKSRGKWRAVIGSIDGTIVPIQAPPNEPSRDYFSGTKKRTALNVQGVVDHKLRFRHVEARFPGSTHDAIVLRNTSVWRDFQNGRRDGIILGIQIISLT